ncbi:MAG: Wzz/FepE/Etk N-terminal domain-containing protein [Gammaproteobacteria bacterium]
MDTSVRETSYHRERDISVFEFWRALADDRWLVVALVVVAAILSTIMALVLTPMYRSEVVVVEVGDGRSSLGTAAMLAPLGGLAGLAGIDLSGFDEGTGRARAVLHSRMLVEEFISRHDLLPVIFNEAWNSETESWVEDSDEAPTLWLGVRHFLEDVRGIEEDPAAGVIRISVEWKDPELAAEWANGLVALANNIVRTRDLMEAERNLAYLNDQISRTNVVELQQVLYSLVESEMQTMMLAKLKEEYAFAVIDPAVPAERRSFPHRALLVAVGTILGGFIALFVVLVRLVLKRQKAWESYAD